MGRLRDWCLDWIDRAGVAPSASRIDDPLAVVSRVASTLGGLLLVASSDVVGLLVPDINPNAEVVLRVVTVLAALVAVNHVVTAKDNGQAEAGAPAGALTYRYSSTDRLIARAVVAVGLLLVALNFVPAPKPATDCALTATVDWPAPSSGATPLALALVAGGREQRLPVAAGRAVAMRVAAAHLRDYSVILLWSDASRSDFGSFSGCPARSSRGADDGRADIDMAGREVAAAR